MQTYKLSTWVMVIMYTISLFLLILGFIIISKTFGKYSFYPLDFLFVIIFLLIIIFLIYRSLTMFYRVTVENKVIKFKNVVKQIVVPLNEIKSINFVRKTFEDPGSILIEHNKGKIRILDFGEFHNFAAKYKK